MVPKTSSSSASKAGGSATASSSSSDLYHKMHDYVLSRTPDQSATTMFTNQIMRVAVATISQEIGWNTAHMSALDVLSDIAARYLLQIAKQAKKYTEHYGRTLVNEDDVALSFKDMNISISELEEYIQNFDTANIPREVPYIPVPRKTELNCLRPGSTEVLTRPMHVHEYMPPMILEQSEEESDSEKEKEVLLVDVPMVSEEVQVKSEPIEETTIVNGSDLVQNGILPFVVEEPSQVPEVASELVVSELEPVVITEEVEVKTENTLETEIPPEETKSVLHQVSIVQNDLEESSDDDIEPTASKAASIFATFKSTKKLESASENAALNRVRKMLEEYGHPVREVTSVIMTTSGYLSESREGRLPENKPPAMRSFFDPPTPPPKEIKKTTVKKILQGVKKPDNRHTDSEEENMEGPRLFGVPNKITTSIGNITGAPNEITDAVGENGVLADINKDIPKKLSKQERKLLHQKQKKELKLRKRFKSKSKDKILMKAKSVQAAAANKELESSTSSGIKNKLTIFSTKKSKSSKIDTSGSSPVKKKKKDKKNKLKVKELKRPVEPIEEQLAIMKAPAPPAGTELIESDEDFSNADGGVVSPVHIRHPGAHAHAPVIQQQMPLIIKKKIKMEKESAPVSSIAVKMKPPVLNFNHHMSKKIVKQEKHPTIADISVPILPPMSISKAKINKIAKRPMLREGHGEPLLKKKRGRPKKIWGEGGMNLSSGVPPGGPVPLPPGQLANIGKSLMIKEPTLKLNKAIPSETPMKLMKIRKEHMEIQDLVPNTPPTLMTKPPSISPNKGAIGPAAAALASPELLKRLPAQPGLIPDRISPVPPVRIPKDLPASISITPAALSSPQKEIAGPSSTRGFPGALPPNVCSSVTITRINMSHQPKLPSPYDDSVTPGIGPPPGLEGPHKRSKLKGVPPPPPLQIPIQAETESGITITPIMMGGGGATNKDHRYDHPLPPPPPLQERPTPKHSMIAKLDEELSSVPPAPSSSSKEQRRKEKEKRKELKKEKKKKAKDKDKDKSKEKSEKKKKKKDKSGETASSGDIVETHTPPPATVPKLTLKLGGHSNTPTPVDSPNPPQVYHEPPLPAPPPLKKVSLKLQEEPKLPKQKAVPLPEEEDLEVARFAPLVTRPQKPARAAKAHAAAAVAAVAMGTSVSQQEIVQFPSSKDSKADSRRGRGRPPKGGAVAVPTPPPPSTSKQAKSSLTVLETETVGCIIDDQGNKIWICPACGRQDDGSPMIGCDICDDWYHFACMGIEQEPKEEEQWFCPRCMRKQKPEGKQKKKK